MAGASAGGGAGVIGVSPGGVGGTAVGAVAVVVVLVVAAGAVVVVAAPPLLLSALQASASVKQAAEVRCDAKDPASRWPSLG